MLEPSIEELVLSGVVEVSGIDADSGEFLYSFKNNINDVIPEFMDKRINFVKNEVDFFIELGFLEMNNPKSKNPIMFLTDKAFDEEEISNLSKRKQNSLDEIKRLFEER
jgi:hypothetical protein